MVHSTKKKQLFIRNHLRNDLSFNFIPDRAIGLRFPYTREQEIKCLKYCSEHYFQLIKVALNTSDSEAV